MLKNKIMGLDVGSKTVGVAISDAFGWTAQGIETIQIDEQAERFEIDKIMSLIKTYNCDKVVVGLPKNMNNTIGERGEAAKYYGQLIQQQDNNIEIIMWDERLSTMAAERTLLEADVSRKKRKKVIDKMAAVFILQGYLDSIS